MSGSAHPKTPAKQKVAQTTSTPASASPAVNVPVSTPAAPVPPVSKPAGPTGGTIVVANALSPAPTGSLVAAPASVPLSLPASAPPAQPAPVAVAVPAPPAWQQYITAFNNRPMDPDEVEALKTWGVVLNQEGKIDLGNREAIQAMLEQSQAEAEEVPGMVDEDDQPVVEAASASSSGKGAKLATTPSVVQVVSSPEDIEAAQSIYAIIKKISTEEGMKLDTETMGSLFRILARPGFNAAKLKERLVAIAAANKRNFFEDMTYVVYSLVSMGTHFPTIKKDSHGDNIVVATCMVITKTYEITKNVVPSKKSTSVTPSRIGSLFPQILGYALIRGDRYMPGDNSILGHLGFPQFSGLIPQEKEFDCLMELYLKWNETFDAIVNVKKSDPDARKASTKSACEAARSSAYMDTKTKVRILRELFVLAGGSCGKARIDGTKLLVGFDTIELAKYLS